MPSKTIYHYVYFIENLSPLSSQRFYIGSRSSVVHPDLDINYMGSSEYLDADLVNLHLKFKKTILSYHETRDDAFDTEFKLLKFFGVPHNKEFYNKTNCSGISSLGMATYKDSNNTIFYIPTNSSIIEELNLKGYHYNTVSCVEKSTGIFRRVPAQEFGDLYDGAAKKFMQNKTIFKTESKNVIMDIDLAKSLGYRGINHQKSSFKHSITGETKQMLIDDPLVLDGTFVGITKGSCVFKDKDNNTVFCSNNDIRVKDGTLTALSANTTCFKHSITGQTTRLAIDDPLVLDGTYVGIRKGQIGQRGRIYLSNYVDRATGKITIKVPKTDPRVISGEYILPRVFDKLFAS